MDDAGTEDADGRAEPAPRPAPKERLKAARLYRLAQTPALPLGLVALVGVISMINHFSGHDWGDDFALYLRQAAVLTLGNVGEVISDNKFTVENSGWHTFSLQDPDAAIQAFGSQHLGHLALVGLVVLASLGLVARLRYRWHEDIGLAVFLGCSALLTLVWPAQEPRYLYAVTPLLAYFAYQALPTITRADDIVLFFRSRTMTFYTDRRATMGVDLDLLLPRSDWFVMDKDGTYSQRLLTADEAASYGLTKAWENEAWILREVPS